MSLSRHSHRDWRNARQPILCPFGTVYDKEHIEKRGYYCRYKHLEYRWPARFSGRFCIIGDSIVKFVNSCESVDVFAFPGANIDTIYWKLRLGKIPFTNYEIIVLHVGTNDYSSGIATDRILARYRRLISLFHHNNPNILIGISALIPRPCDSIETKDKLTDLNRALHNLCKESDKTRFFKTYRAFVDKKTKETLTDLYVSNDRLHLNFKGVSILKKSLIGNIRTLQGNL